jgi:hypothetical protein
MLLAPANGAPDPGPSRPPSPRPSPCQDVGSRTGTFGFAYDGPGGPAAAQQVSASGYPGETAIFVSGRALAA